MGDNNNRNNDVELIKEAIGNPDGCEIDYDVEDVKFYTIRPENGQKTLQIKSSIDIIKIKDFNLYFENCIFENKTLFKDVEFQKDIGFQQEILFDNCRFNKSVDFSNVKFKKSIDFTKSIFEKDVYFEGATFDERISFCKSTSNGSVDFSCSAFNDMADFSETTFKQKALFRKSFFNKKAIFNDVEFGGTESARNSHVNFSDATFKNEAVFSGARFQYEADFQASHFEDVLEFKNANFLQKVDFERAHFKERAFFAESHFHKKTNFSNVTFDHNAYFDKAKFEKEVKFSQAEFYKNAHFYGTEFEEFPNFIQVIFNENVNFINTKSNIKFEKAIEQIETLYIEKKTEYDNQAEEDREGKEEPKKYKIANEFRDSFRTIKSALIKDNNMLDASNYHRIELYCKELELEHKRKQTAEESDFRDTVDRIQLMFYRLTSDHHTKLLMILNNVIFLIALFGIANLVLCLCNKICTTTISPLVEIIVSIIFVSIAICFLFECCKKLIFAIVVLIDICALLMICAFQPYLVFAVICYMVLIFFVLLGCAICCLDKICACEIKNCIFAFSYLMVMFMLFTTPSSILPILGKLIENKSTEICLFVVGNVKLLCYDNTHSSQTLNLIYMLFLFLLLWSLQKTARKNTIVPS